MKLRTNRRQVLGGLAASVAAPGILTATRAYAQNPTIKVGFVTPSTGPLAGFAEPDDYVIEGLQAALAGVENNGKTYAIEIIKKDSQSNPNRAAEVAAQLILDDEVDFITAAGTPDTTNPVADQAEINEIPCVTSDAPWQPYFFGRNGNPAEGFQYTYHFFWGLEDVIANFTNIWNDSGVPKKVGGLFPNDSDGNAWGHPELGLPTPLAAQGFELTDPGRYQPLNDDFSNYIAAFKEAGCEILTGVMIPPDFGTFWSQAAQQGFQPKIATVGKALLFPSVVESLGPRGVGLTTEVWWSASHPFSSSLTGQSAGDLANGYTTATGRPWTQPIGFKHALSEVIADVVRRSEDIEDAEANVAAIRATNLSTIVGDVNWSNGPVPNVSKTPLVGGQWQDNGNGLELVITNNKHAPQIPTGGETFLLG
ncbi:ABC transporter substrate-binding protein [Ruegeria arenilitoris]|uniref:ABC transporter substrate-binding protein n=1 Tax=Ruegeria arenilitoris TaxID=1173585 RepID=UPI00147F4F68|nr:ABC transporter substrate-binding protein [Ruegeria arenilitoris]